MATTNINVRVDANLKQSAESLFADLGLNMMKRHKSNRVI